MTALSPFLDAVLAAATVLVNPTTLPFPHIVLVFGWSVTSQPRRPAFVPWLMMRAAANGGPFAKRCRRRTSPLKTLVRVGQSRFVHESYGVLANHEDGYLVGLLTPHEQPHGLSGGALPGRFAIS